MRAAAIFGPGANAAALRQFQLPGIELLQFAAQHESGNLDALLIFGGDGTLHHQIPFLAECKAPMMAVPVGSGNDFAQSQGLRTVADALALWKNFCAGKAKVRELDLGVIQTGVRALARIDGESGASAGQSGVQTFFCNVASVGLDAAAARQANTLSPWLRAHGGYMLSAVLAILFVRPEKVKLLTCKSNGEWAAWLDERASLVAVGNGSTYGGGIKIAPNARMDDGKLDICYIRASSRLRMLSLLPKVRRGEHLNLREVEYLRTEHFRLDGEMPLEIYADGEYVGLTPAEVRILPGALRAISRS